MAVERGGRITAATINFGDGSQPVKVRGRQVVEHNYERPGMFTPRLVVTTVEGEELDSRTRVRVRPERPADPAELLSVVEPKGTVPFDAKFRIGGDSLPFVAREMVLDFGDGVRKEDVSPLTQVTHKYARPGRYNATLQVQGKHGNIARSQVAVEVVPEARLKMAVSPWAGVAPMEVTVRVGNPGGKIRLGELRLDGEVFATKAGEYKKRFDKAGTYVFELYAESLTGKEWSEKRTVEVYQEELSGYYNHDDGVVKIEASNGAFRGIMLAPTPAQAKLGYDINEEIVRGAYADVATIVEAAADPRDRPFTFFHKAATQIHEGEYLMKNGPNCPTQWADYQFRVDFGQRDSDDANVWKRRQSIKGDVHYAEWMQLYELVYKQAGLPVPRPGIAGHVGWLAEILGMMGSQGVLGDPFSCVTDDHRSARRSAVFTRLSEEEAAKLARKNMGDVLDFADNAFDLHTPDPDYDSFPPAEPVASEDPVLLHSGDFIETATDLHVPGRGLDWSFQRTYRSQSADNTSLGYGWTHNALVALMRHEDGYVFRSPLGAKIRFSRIADGLFGSTSGMRLRVAADQRSVRDVDGTQYHFQAAPDRPDVSHLQAVEDASGNRLTYVTDLFGRVHRVIDTLGRAAYFRYDEATGQLREVEAPDGRRVEFQHNQQSDLVAVRYFAPGAVEPYRAVTYAYSGGAGRAELNHNMTHILRPADQGKQQSTVEMRYGDRPDTPQFDRVLWQRNGQLVETFDYSVEDDGAGAPVFQATVKAEGRADAIHDFQNGLEIRRTLRTPERELTIRKAYDVAGRLVSITYPRGNGREILRDAHHNPKAVRYFPPPGSKEPARVFLVEYEPVFHQLKAMCGPFAEGVPEDPKAIEAALIVRRDYDYEESEETPDALALFGIARAAGGIGDVNADGHTDGAAGRVVRITRPAEDDPRGPSSKTEQKLFSYNAFGLLERVSGSAGAVRNYKYQLTSAGEPGFLSRVVELSSTGHEQLLAGYEWDKFGRLIGVVNHHGTRSGIVRDDLGRAIMIVPQDVTRLRRRLEYDAEGRVVAEWRLSESERLAKEKGAPFAEYTYDTRGGVIAAKLWAGADESIERTYEHDQFGRMVAVVAGEARWSRRFDPFGHVVQEGIDGPGGFTRTFEYDANGNLVAETDRQGREFAYRYDGHDRLVGVRRPDGVEIEKRWSLASRLLEQRTYKKAGDDQSPQLLHSTGVTYSSGGRPTGAWVGHAEGNEIVKRHLFAAEYDEAGRLARLNLHSEGQDNALTFKWSADGTLHEVAGDDGPLVMLGRDRSGRITYVARSFGAGAMQTSGYAYAEGRTASVLDLAGRSTMADDERTRRRITRQFSPDGRETMRAVVEFDGIGRPTRFFADSPDQGDAELLLDWAFQWDNYSRLEAITAGGQSLARFARDPAGRLTAAEFYHQPPGGDDGIGVGLLRRTFEYSENGELHAAVDGLGNRAVYQYDAAGRPIEVRHVAAGENDPDSVQQVEYDDLGRVIAHGRDGWNVTRRLDNRGNPVSHQVSDDASNRTFTVKRQYDEHGSLRSATLPSGLQVTIAADGSRVAFGSLEAVVQYGPDGWPAVVQAGQVTLHNEHRLLPGGGQTFDIRLETAGEVRLGYRYELRSGLLQSIQTAPAGPNITYQRDAMGRLTTGEALLPAGGGPAAVPFQIAYDDRGNRESETLGDEKTTYQPRADYGPARVGEAEVRYDADGKVTGLGGQVFAHDLAGQLTECRDDARGLKTEYRRDALGRVVERRAAGEEANFVYDHTGLIGEYVDGEVRCEYVRDGAGHLIGVVADGSPLLAMTAPNGSLLALVDPAGKIRQRFFYGPFGRTFATNATGETATEPLVSALYAGMLYDPAMGIYLLPRRAYWPRLGRFLSPEPLGPLASPHPYAYALDDPATFCDKSGTQPGLGLTPDVGISDLPRKAVEGGYLEAGKTIDEKLTGRMNEGNEGRDSPNGRGADGSPPNRGPDGRPHGGDVELPPPPVRTPEQEAWEAARQAEEEEERQERRESLEQRRRESAQMEKNLRRNRKYARSILPKNIGDYWLDDETRPKVENLGWGEDQANFPWDVLSGPTPLEPAEGGPNGLLREVLNEPHLNRDPESQIRQVLADLLGEEADETAVRLPGPNGPTTDAAAATQLPGQGPTSAPPTAVPGGVTVQLGSDTTVITEPDGSSSVSVGEGDGKVEVGADGETPPPPEPGGITGIFGGS